MLSLREEAGLADLTLADIDEALRNVRATLRQRLTVHQREAAEQYRDYLLDRRLVLCAVYGSYSKV